MSESGLNSTVEDFETYIPRGIEHILALVRSLQHLFPFHKFLGYTADFKAAYRQIAVAPDQFKLQGIAWWDCKQNKVMVGVQLWLLVHGGLLQTGAAWSLCS